MIKRTVIYVLYGIMGLAFVYLFSQIFVFASFKIPSDSMHPELKQGDHILVVKPIYGARLFDVFATLSLKQVEIYRTPGFRNVQRNDVVVFNNPYPILGNGMCMHILKYYVKRCVGIPGDSLFISDYHYLRKGDNQIYGNVAIQNLLRDFLNLNLKMKGFAAFPFDSLMQWNIKDFGPMYIPAKGDSMNMNRVNYLLYKRLIERETGKCLFYKNTQVYLDSLECKGYRFQKNYYFMAGENVMNSSDSRYWGLVPEEYIVGKVWMIWRSVDPVTKKYNWERCVKLVN